MRTKGKFARAIPSSGIEVVTYSLVVFVWLRIAVLFGMAAVIVHLLSQGSRSSTLPTLLQVIFWGGVSIISFAFCVER